MTLSLPDKVYASLKSEIISHKIWPSSQLNIDSISTRFGVSAIPVREALIRLCSEGLAVQENRQGFKVRTVTPRLLEDDYRTLSAIMQIGAFEITDSLARQAEREPRLQQSFDTLDAIANNVEVEMLDDVLLSWAGSERLTVLGSFCRSHCRFLTKIDIELRGADGHARYTRRRQRAAAALVKCHGQLAQKLIVEEREWRINNIPFVIREMLYRQLPT